jgi:hypothetical protein
MNSPTESLCCLFLRLAGAEIMLELPNEVLWSELVSRDVFSNVSIKCSMKCL